MKKTPTSSLVCEEIKHQTNQSAGYISENLSHLGDHW